MQNPDTDPQVIDYCLENMRVAWARVEFPWFFWHPSDTINPLENARAGNINPRLQKTIDNTKRLHDLGLPVVLSAWFPPNWSIEGEWNFRQRRKPGDPWGKALDQTRTEEIYKSITDYIIFLKEEHGVEINMFSFNESDLGIYVRQTGEEHQKLIKELGAYFKSKGLKTKMLLATRPMGMVGHLLIPQWMIRKHIPTSVLCPFTPGVDGMMKHSISGPVLQPV